LRSRSQRAALRRALVSFDADAALHHPGFKEAADDLEQAFVANAPRQAGHQDVVVDPVEKFFQIKINDDLAAVGDVALGLGLGERLMGAAPRAETEARCREGRIEDRFQET
jgi:hypothetical protein